MTDEKVREEFEVWAIKPYSADEINFAFTSCEKNERKASFYAGFRTAERLAKIEVLEEVVRIAENNGSYRFIDKVTDMLDELKECN